MPLVVPLAVLLFLGSLVPLIGVLVAGVVVCLIAFVSQGLTTAIVVAIALVLIVQLFGNLLNPIILGKAVDIHPLAILVGVTGGTLVAGIFGAFVAVPFVAVVNNAIRAVRETGTAVAEVALCYTADLLDPAEKLYTLDYYLDLAQQCVDAGAHVLAIKDMAGLLRAPAARTLVTALRERFDLPVHLHTHDTAGGQLATLLAAIDAGVDAVDVASAAMSGTTSQPSMSALVAATDGTDRATGLDLANVCDLEPYWEAVRTLYKPFESGLPAPTGRVYRHEIPGGQLSNLRQQAIALGLGERFDVPALTRAGAEIRGWVIGAPLQPELDRDIRSAYEKLCAENGGGELRADEKGVEGEEEDRDEDRGETHRASPPSSVAVPEGEGANRSRSTRRPSMSMTVTCQPSTVTASPTLGTRPSSCMTQPPTVS